MPSLGKVVSELEYNTLPSPMRRQLASKNTSSSTTNNNNNTAAVDGDNIVSEKQTQLRQLPTRSNDNNTNTNGNVSLSKQLPAPTVTNNSVSSNATSRQVGSTNNNNDNNKFANDIGKDKSNQINIIYNKSQQQIKPTTGNINNNSNNKEQTDASRKKKTAAIPINGTRHLWDPHTIAQVEAAKKKKMAEAESIVIHDARNNIINNKNNNNNNMDVEIINIDDDEDGDDDHHHQGENNNNNSASTKVALFNVGPLPDAYKERMVLPLEHTQNLMKTMKNFAVMLADVQQKKGNNISYFDILTRANIMTIAQQVPTHVSHLSACGISSQTIEHYGNLIANTVSDYIFKQKLQVYVSTAKYLLGPANQNTDRHVGLAYRQSTTNRNNINPPPTVDARTTNQHQRQQSRRNDVTSNHNTANNSGSLPAIERFSEYRIDNATSINDLETIRRRLMTLLDRTEEWLKEKRLMDAMAQYGEENLEQLPMEELMNRLSNVVDKTTSVNVKRNGDEMTNGDNKRQRLPTPCPLCFQKTSSPVTCQTCEESGICKQCHSSCTCCRRPTCADCLMICDGCHSRYHCVDCMGSSNGKCTLCRPKKAHGKRKPSYPTSKQARNGGVPRNVAVHQVNGMMNTQYGNHSLQNKNATSSLSQYTPRKPPPPQAPPIFISKPSKAAVVTKPSKPAKATTTTVTKPAQPAKATAVTKPSKAAIVTKPSNPAQPAKATTVAKPSDTVTKPSKSPPNDREYSFHTFLISESSVIGLNFTLETKTKKVRVSNVHPNSVATKHGVLVNDEIISTLPGGMENPNIYTLFLEAAKHRPLRFEVKRPWFPGTTFAVSGRKALHRFTITKPSDKLGMTLGPLNIGNGRSMARITSIVPDSLADIYGLQVGDIICEPLTNGRELTDFNSFKALVMSGIRPLNIEVLRDVGGQRKIKGEASNANSNPFVFSFPKSFDVADDDKGGGNKSDDEVISIDDSDGSDDNSSVDSEKKGDQHTSWACVYCKKDIGSYEITAEHEKTCTMKPSK